MPRIARLIIYEGSDIDLAKQLAQSMPEGINEKSKVKITIIKLSKEPVLNAFVEGALIELQGESKEPLISDPIDLLKK
jgi:hypothetical protein